MSVVMMMMMVVVVPMSTVKVTLVYLRRYKKTCQSFVVCHSPFVFRHGSWIVRIESHLCVNQETSFSQSICITYPEHTNCNQRQTHDCASPLGNGGNKLTEPILEQLNIVTVRQSSE